MVSKRTPSPQQLAELTRDEWQALCADLVALVYQAQRVEDSHGKGNGLDAWRSSPEGPEGFQHRRYDDRFNAKQAEKLRDNIALACERAPHELGAPLRRYVVLANIDLEPGHAGKSGELDRFSQLATWAQDTQAVQLEWHGVTWVHAQLLVHPHLRPELFEDLGASLDAAYAALLQRQLDISRELAELRDAIRATPLAPVLDEARRSYEDGVRSNSDEGILEALTHLDRAVPLAEVAHDDVMLGRILTLRCGVNVLAGRLAAAITDGRRAVTVLTGTSAHDQIRWARGNLAYALALHQEYIEARGLFTQVLADSEEAGDFLDVIRTVNHFAQLHLDTKAYAQAAVYASRLELLIEALEHFGHRPGEILVGVLGTLANVRLELGKAGDVDQARMAEEAFLATEKHAETLKLERFAVSSRAARAQSLWYQHRIADADALFLRVIAEASPEFGKIAADSIFNRAMMLREAGRDSAAVRQFVAARERYLALGDQPSIADVNRQLKTFTG